jgi:hypothetical protein
LHQGPDAFNVRVRNISAHGGMVDGDELPAKGTKIRLERGSLAVDGSIVREIADLRGIRFDSPIKVDDWVKRIGHAGQQEVDRAVSALRSGATVPELAKQEASVALLAKELQQICEEMAAKPNLAAEVGDSLIKIDLIAAALVRLGEER